MEKKEKDFQKSRSKQKEIRRQIDIPLENVGKDPEIGAGGISVKELEFVNRHHEEYKELRRRARRQGGY